jgi:predicted GNAT superfamily acetyltransferase
MMNKQNRVERATEADIPGIIAVLEEHLLLNKEKSAITQLEQSGFLMKRHSENELLEWMQNEEKHIVLVCREDQEVQGYLLACDMHALSAEMQAHLMSIEAIKNILKVPVLYHKQIAIKANQKGVGTALLQEFFNIALLKGYNHIVCLIVHEPVLNKVSLCFHQKHGFEYMGEVEIDDDINDGVYLKKF